MTKPLAALLKATVNKLLITFALKGLNPKEVNLTA